MNMKNDQEAIVCFNQAIELKPDCADFYFIKGKALDNLGKQIEAIECYNKAIELKPDYLDVYMKKGIILFNLNKK